MKTIISEGVSIYCLADTDTIVLKDDRVEVRGEKDFDIGFLNSTNTDIYENVTPPADWRANKYLFNGDAWIINPAQPSPRTVTMRQARLALLDAGLLEAVNTAITQATPKAQIEWEYSTTVEKDSALVSEIGASLGLSDTDINALFAEAHWL